MTTIKVSAFRWVPPVAQGLVRDLRVRWALEEAGLAYEERLIGPADQKSDGYRALQPFGQVPSYEENGLELFESGAIVLHIADDADHRHRVVGELNSEEPDQIATCHRNSLPPKGRDRHGAVATNRADRHKRATNAKRLRL